MASVCREAPVRRLLLSPALRGEGRRAGVVPGWALSTTPQERVLETQSKQSTPGGSRKSHRKGRKYKIKLSRARGHHPKEEKVEGNLVVAVKTIEVSGKDEENKLDLQVLSGFEDNKCFICNKEDCHYLLAKILPMVSVVNILTPCLGRF